VSTPSRLASRRVKRPVRACIFGAVVVIGLASCSSSAKPAAAPATTSTAPPVTAPLTLASQAQVSLLYTQGVARVPNGWIFTSEFGLYRTDDALHVVAHVDNDIPADLRAQGYKHLGDIDVVGNVVYAALEQEDYTRGTQRMVFFDAGSLRFLSSVTVHQHQNSFVTVDASTMIAYTMDEFDGNTLLRYDVAHDWLPLAPLQMTETLHHTQGADVGGGAVWVSTDDAVKGVYRVDLATGAVTKAAEMGHAAGGEGEGLDVTNLPSGFVHTLVAEGTAQPSWFQHWRAPY
jgi:hypothetical protein